MFLLDAEECNNGSEECYTLDKSCCHNHVSKQFVHHLGLASHSVHGLTTDFTNTKTCANGCETCTYCGAQLCNAFNC